MEAEEEGRVPAPPAEVPEVPAMPVPAAGEEPENQVEAEEEGRVPAPPAEVPEVPAMPVPAAGEEPENQVEAEEEGRVPAPPAEVPEVPAMPVPAAGEEPENQVEAEEEGRVPAPPAEVPEVPAMPVAAPEERVPAPRGPQRQRQPNRADFKGVWEPIQCPHCPKVAGELKHDPNPGGKDIPTPHWILRVRKTEDGLLERFRKFIRVNFDVVAFTANMCMSHII